MTIHRSSAQVRFRDGDLFGHVNNGVHLTLFEDARYNFYAQIEKDGLSFDDLVGPERFVVVSGQRVEYVEPLHVRPEPVTVDLWVSRVGNSSFVLDYRLHDAAGGHVYALATSSLVLASRLTGRPEPLSATQRSLLEPYIGAPVEFRN